MVRSGEFVNGLHPEFIWEVEGLFTLLRNLLDLSECFCRKDRFQDRGQLVDAVLEHRVQPFPVEAPRLDSGTVFEAEDGRLLRRLGARQPIALLSLHAAEERAKRFLNGGDDVLDGMVRRMDFGAEKRLAKLVAVGDRSSDHPDFRMGPDKFLMPDILFQVLARQPSGEPKLATHRLADLHAVNRADYRRDDVV